jgi:cytochrome c-type biogenesis protein CcmH
MRSLCGKGRVGFVCLLFLSIAFASYPALASSYGPERLSDPKLEARAQALQHNLRCVVCQGEALDESNAQLADDLRRLIRARIAAGESDSQITDFLVSRYGDLILMKPPLRPDTYGLWFGPLLILLAGGGVAAWVVSRAYRRSSTLQDINITDRNQQGL